MGLTRECRVALSVASPVHSICVAGRVIGEFLDGDVVQIFPCFVLDVSAVVYDEGEISIGMSVLDIRVVCYI